MKRKKKIVKSRKYVGRLKKKIVGRLKKKIVGRLKKKKVKLKKKRGWLDDILEDETIEPILDIPERTG